MIWYREDKVGYAQEMKGGLPINLGNSKILTVGLNITLFPDVTSIGEYTRIISAAGRMDPSNNASNISILLREG